MKKLKVVLAGLGFGASFAEIYKEHPLVEELSVFDPNRELEETFRKKLGIKKQYKTFDEVVSDSEIDAVQLMTPIPLHVEQSIALLNAGKHCACAVPMANSLEEIQRVTEAKRKSGKNYMMMETELYTDHFFYAQKMIKDGTLGKIQFIRGSHYQDMQNWPEYWMGLPPMYYGTHAIGPMVALSGSRIKRVHCFGSGTMEEWMTKRYSNPFPVESALFEFENGLKGEATRSLFETARAFQMGFFVYGSKACFEWGFSHSDDPYVTVMLPPQKGVRGAEITVNQVHMPNSSDSLPDEIKRFSVGYGSHAHLIHEFLCSIVENRKPWIDEVLSGNITAAGICAHESAMKNGAEVIVPEF